MHVSSQTTKHFHGTEWMVVRSRTIKKLQTNCRLSSHTKADIDTHCCWCVHYSQSDQCRWPQLSQSHGVSDQESSLSSSPALSPCRDCSPCSPSHVCHKTDWLIEQCLTSPPTQCRLSGTGRQVLNVKRPNQQYQSTEGKKRYKGKPRNSKNTIYTYTRDDND